MLTTTKNPLQMYRMAEKLYEERQIDWVAETAEYIVSFRDWAIEPDLVARTISPTKVRRMPKDLATGGAFFFPIYDNLDCLNLAQLRFIKPNGYVEKYFIGEKRGHLSATWYGMDKFTANQIILKKRVIIVEGPFDALACQIALGTNDFPILCAFGKKLNKKQIFDLELLGVNRVLLMFDQDQVGKRGANDEMLRLPFKVQILKCPTEVGGDPSDSLKTMKSFNTLGNLLHMATGVK